MTQIFLFRELSRLSEKFKSAEDSLREIRWRSEALSPVEARLEAVAEEVSRMAAVLSGRRSGKGGENLLEEVLADLPPEILARGVEMGEGRVEFALRLPDGSLIPLDSKFVEPGTDSRGLSGRLLSRARELTKYLKDSRAAGVALAAVPDGVYPEACRILSRSFLENRVILIPYSQALPLVLYVWALASRFPGGARGEPNRHLLEEMEKNLAQQERLLQQLLQRVANFKKIIIVLKQAVLGHG
ncbi:hypothetical protein [Thermosulfurimonas marina]|uniref:hypothetical protein n=1 Tax=Thermosulfurimonas marina TaxID=2047767 RepID=UPI00144A64A7|nr:hypothetical protein [Thermosulfurimonas marina]